MVSAVVMSVMLSLAAASVTESQAQPVNAAKVKKCKADCDKKAAACKAKCKGKNKGDCASGCSANAGSCKTGCEFQ